MKNAKIENTVIILPVYNSERHLTPLMKSIEAYLPAKQVIAIDDGSNDNSAQICKSLEMNLISFEINKGKGAALQAGLIKAAELGYDFAFCLDSDQQHDPAHIPAFLKKQNDTNAGVVLGFRQLTPKYMPLARICSNKLTSFMVSITTGKWIKDSQCGYRLYRLHDLKNLKFKTSRYQFETEILLKLAVKKTIFAQVPISTIYGEETSHISHLRDIKNFIKVILNHWFKRNS